MENNRLIPIPEIVQTTLTLNYNVIISRTGDNYVNATQLCQAGGKKFNDWFILDSTKQLINALIDDIIIKKSAKIETGIYEWDSDPNLVVRKEAMTFLLVHYNLRIFFRGTWIHPDLAISLAQWISPDFALKVSHWIRNYFISDRMEFNKLIQEKDKRIKFLENKYLKKHQRIKYPHENVIYMLTTEDNKKNRIYIIGKAKKLKDRLSSYNKTAEHEVVYYKTCYNKANMDLAELMVLNKLQKYKEQANRDRFILPLHKEISYFIEIIDKCCNFL
jgi:KilA-N domain/T5orf172 domain